MDARKENSTEAKVPVSDMMLLLGVAFICFFAGLQLHQKGTLEIGLREVPTRRINGHQNTDFLIEIDPNQAGGQLTANLEVLLFEDGQRLRQAGSISEVRRKSGGRYYLERSKLFVSSLDKSKDIATNWEDFQLMQPIAIHPWIRGSVAGLGMLLLIGGLVATVVARWNHAFVNCQPGFLVKRYTLAGGKWIATAAALVGTWILTGNLIRSLDSSFVRTEFGKKVELAFAGEDLANKYDSVFIGSSRTFRHAIPTRFDNEVKKFGYEISSVNLGVNGTRAIETPTILRELFKVDQEDQIKYVFIQLEPIGWEYDDENLLAERTVRCHDLFSLSLLAQYYWNYVERPKQERLRKMTRRIRSFLNHQNNIGVGSGGFTAWIDHGGKQAAFEARIKKYERGFGPLDAETNPIAKRNRALFQARAGKKLDGLVLPYAPKERDADSPVAFKLIKKIDDIVRDHGAIPVFVESPPTLNVQLNRAREAGLIQNLIRLNDVEKYPELIRQEYYFDIAHLNHAGAKLFTDQMATEFVQLVDGIRVAERKTKTGVLR